MFHLAVSRIQGAYDDAVLPICVTSLRQQYDTEQKTEIDERINDGRPILSVYAVWGQ